MHNTITLTQKIFQTLLYFGEAVSFIDLAKFLNIKIEEIIENLINIEDFSKSLALNLIQTETHLEITLSPEISKIINTNKTAQLKEDLSESSLEVISVVLYKEKVSKAEIDFVRGVDSSRSIKSLLLRGLIEKSVIKNKTFYLPTIDTLKYLNINKHHDLIEFKEINDRLKNLIEGKDE
jgi:segregation and condensation protein B